MEPMNEVSDVKIYPPDVTNYFRGIYDDTIITKVNYDKESGNKAFKDGIAGLVAYGRLLFPNPDLPARFKANTKLNNPDKSTF